MPTPAAQAITTPLQLLNGAVLGGAGAPEGVVTAAEGATYTQTDATDGRGEWVKPAGSGLNAVGFVRKYTSISTRRMRVSDSVGATLNGTRLQACFDAAANERVHVELHRTRDPIPFDAELTIPDNVGFIGDGGRGILQQMQSGAHGLLLGNGNTLRQVRLLGVSGTTQDIDVKAISAVGGSAAAPLVDITLEDVQVDSWGMYGLYLQHVQQFRIDAFRATNLWYAGIATLSALHGTIDRAYIDTVNAPNATNAYGMAFSRTQLDNLALSPRSEDILVSNSIVRNVFNWEGFDTHGGKNIRFVNCHALGCYVGFLIGGSKGATAGIGFAPLDCHILGCMADSLRTDGLAGYGAAFVGVSGTLGASVEKATGSIVDFFVKGHGTESAGTSGGIYVHDTLGLTLAQITGQECSPTVLQLTDDNIGFDINGVVAIDTWTNTRPASTAVALTGDYHTGKIDGVTGIRGSKAATHVNDTGISVTNQANMAVKLGLNNNLDVFTTPVADVGNKCSTTARAAVTFKKQATFESGLVSNADLDATGGFRSPPGDGWYLNAVANGTVPMNRHATRLAFPTAWFPSGAGTVTCLWAKVDAALPAGAQINVRLYKNGAYTGFQATIVPASGTVMQRNSIAKDSAITIFAIDDKMELYANVTGMSGTPPNLLAGITQEFG